MKSIKVGRIQTFFTKGNSRTVKAKKNILGMLFIKGGNILVGLLLVPMTLGYVDSEQYGLWMTLSSMVAWMSFFDIGINNGLKNRLTEALAFNDYEKGRKYVSTTYAILSLIFIPLMVILLCLVPLLDWGSLLNIENENVESVTIALGVIVTYFCINFVLSTINIVLLSDQRPADASLRSFIQQIVSLMLIFVLTKTTEGSLVKLCMALCLSPLLVVTLFNVTLFRGRYKQLAPSFSYVDFKVAPELLKLGIQFFIIQIAAIVQYQMINFLILRYYGAEDVTAYNVCYKYFSVITMIWGILTAPLWVAYKEALTKQDFSWIRHTQQHYLKIFALLVLCGLAMLLVSDYVYGLWVGDKVAISFSLSLWIFVYNIVMAFGTLFVYLINASGKLRIQMYASLISPIVFIILSMLFVRIGVGLQAIIIAAIVSNFNGLILAPIQSHYILKNENRL